jgi:hypothetical protein
MAYVLLSKSFGIANANLQVRITELSSGLPATLLETSSGGVLPTSGVAYLDSTGALSVYVEEGRLFNTIVVDANLAPTYPLTYDSTTGSIVSVVSGSVYPASILMSAYISGSGDFSATHTTREGISYSLCSASFPATVTSHPVSLAPGHSKTVSFSFPTTMTVNVRF